jgi:pyruvate,orthophosphate dikinase
MIPLVVSREELALARSWVIDAVAQVASSAPELDGEVEIGTMIETPRAALRAEEIAEEAQFFSFGTNDLTQMTFGFSRDDIEARIMAIYLELGLLKANPFDTVDTAGVGELIRLAATRGRATKADLKLGICGEHGGDPASIEFFARIGIDYVSCSPFRVPVARLAAAQALTKIDAEKN